MGIAPHTEVRITPPNAHIKMIQPMATTTNKDHTKQQASTRKVRRGALSMTKGEVGKETPRTKTMRTLLSMPQSMWMTSPVTYLARIITRRNSMTRLPRRGTTTQRASRKPRSPNNAKSAQYARHLPTWGQLPVTTTTTTTPTPVKFAYLRLTDMLNRGGARLSDRTKISSKLKRQLKNGKDKEKNKKFLKSILQVRGFNAFLFMTKDSAIVKMAHSAAKFATINPMADDVDGKIFAFIGDRLANQEPRAILIPAKAWLTWSSHKVANNEKTMLDPYKDKKYYGDLYQETGGKVLKQVPIILAIPLFAVRLFELHKKGKMPHECLTLLLSHINDPNNIGDKTEWNLI